MNIKLDKNIAYLAESLVHSEWYRNMQDAIRNYRAYLIVHIPSWTENSIEEWAVFVLFIVIIPTYNLVPPTW